MMTVVCDPKKDLLFCRKDSLFYSLIKKSRWQTDYKSENLFPFFTHTNNERSRPNMYYEWLNKSVWCFPFPRTIMHFIESWSNIISNNEPRMNRQKVQFPGFAFLSLSLFLRRNFCDTLCRNWSWVWIASTKLFIIVQRRVEKITWLKY